MAILYGDTSGTLGGRQTGGDQYLVGDSAGSTSVSNTLTGDAYIITDFARGGNDSLQGGSADFLTQRIYGDAYVMNRFAAGGDDLIIGGGGSRHASDRLYGDAYEMHDFAHGGNDQIIGLIATIYGDAYSMDGFTVGGDDWISGGFGILGYSSNPVYGDAAILSGFARGGNDDILMSDYAGFSAFGDGGLSGFARGGNDVIVGGNSAYAQILYGDGSLRDFARGGNDVLVAGTNSNQEMWGDGPRTGRMTVGGNDTFVFGPGIGKDQIWDFEHGKDHIDLTGFATRGIHGFDDLTIQAGSAIPTATDANASSIVFSDSEVIVVHNMPHLQACDFLFA